MTLRGWAMVRGRLKDFAMARRIAALMFAVVILGSFTAFAADDSGTASKSDAEAARLLALAREPHRPVALTVLYGTFAALQTADILSTHQAIQSGAREANPVMSGGTAGMIAVKAAGTAAGIYFAERLWKKNRLAAIMTMVAANGVTAAIVAHNATNIRR